ncbi:MAG: S1 family peptidase [Planctomycetia bacterium]
MTAASAGTIRDDRNDLLYTGLAAQPQFRASGYLRIGTTGVGSATLIDSQWVLTAGHCVIDENGPAATGWQFEIGEQVVDIPVENVFFPTGWITSGFDGGYDLAMLRLPKPFRGVRPAALYTARDEVGKVITTLGYGTTGNGLTGNLLAAGTRRAGQNTIDATAALIRVPGSVQPPLAIGSDRTILYDFDAPSGTLSTLGSPRPLQLEYSCAPGDSGGGAFLMVGGGSRIVGVVSRGYAPTGQAQAVYGTTAVYARVSAHIGWIRAVMGGREMPMPTKLAQLQQETLAAAAAVSRQRTQAAEALGFRDSRFIKRVDADRAEGVEAPSASSATQAP